MNIFLLTFFVFVTELAKASTVQLIPQISKNYYETIGLSFLLYFFQFIGAPVQGSLSDRYHRKTWLIVALTCITISQFLIYSSFYLLIITGIILYALAGNADVMSRAALIDIHAAKGNQRVALGISFVILPPAWILSGFINNLNPRAMIATLLTGIISFLLAIFGSFFFKDSADLKNKTIEERKSTINRWWLLFALVTLLIAEVGYQITYIYQDNITPTPLESIYTIIFGFGFITGVILQMKLKFSDKFATLLGIGISAVSPIIAIIIDSLFNYKSGLLKPIIGYGLFTCGSGIYLPALFSYFSKKYKTHQQGKILGLLDSVLTAGEIIATLILLKPGFQQKTIIILVTSLFSISFFVFLYVFKINGVIHKK